MAGYAGDAISTHESGRRDTLTSNFPTYKEEVAPRISYVQGIETPIQETSTAESCDNQEFSWLMDDVTDNKVTIPTGRLQMADWTTGITQVPGRIRAWSCCQIEDATFGVSDSQMSQDEYSVGNEYDQANWKRLKELGLQMEMVALWPRLKFGSGGAIGAGEASTTEGLIPWALDTAGAGPNVVGEEITGTPAARNTIPAPFQSTVYNGLGVPLTRPILRDSIMQPAWSKGLEWHNMICYVGPEVRNNFASFSHIFNGSGATLTASPLNTRTAPASLKTIIDSVDIYHGPWGVIYVTNHRKLDSTVAVVAGGGGVSIVPSKAMLAYDPRYVQLKFKRSPRTYHQVRLSDGAVGRVLVEFGVQVRTPRALVFAYNIA